jgi:hypothetical protein
VTSVSQWAWASCWPLATIWNGGGITLLLDFHGAARCLADRSARRKARRLQAGWPRLLLTLNPRDERVWRLTGAQAILIGLFSVWSPCSMHRNSDLTPPQSAGCI